MVSEVRFDSRVFNVEAVKAACYRFSDKFSASIALDGFSIVCTLRFDSNLSDSAVPLEIERLQKEVLDQDLRQKLKTETEGVRNLILAHAFSKTGLIVDE